MGKNRFYRQILLLVATHCFSDIGFAQTLSEFKYDLDNAKSNRVKADICFNISRKYADGLKIDSALYFAEKVKEFSQKENYNTGLGKYHLALSAAYYFRGRNDESKKNAGEAIKIFTSQKESSFLGIAYWQLATCEESENVFTSSRKNYWTSIYLLIAAGDDHNLFRTYFWMARSYDKTSDYDSAASYYIKALTLAEQSKDPYKIYTASGELGKTFLYLHNLPKANEYLTYGLAHSVSATNKVGVWTHLSRYAICLSLLHDFKRADSAINEFEISAKKFNHAWGWVTLNKLKGIQHYEKQDFPEALEFLRNAYKQENHAVVGKKELKEIVFNLARTEFKMKKYDSSIIHFKHATELSHSVNDLIEALECNLLISESFERINKPDSALYYFRQYFALKESVLSVEKQKMIAEVTTRYEIKKEEQAFKILQKENEASSYMLRLRNQEIEKQQLENERKSQELQLVSKQNEINKLDADQKALSLDIEKKENEKKQVRLEGLQKESALQFAVARNLKQRRNLAYGMIALILVFSAYGYYRYRQNKKLSNQLSRSLDELKQAQEQLIKFEKEKAAENIRLRISRDIHDEVGATLSGVALYSEIAKQKMEQHNEQDAQIYLDHISANSKEMVEKIGDIVWTINPANDSIDRIISKLKSWAVNLCSGKSIQIHFRVDDEIKNSFPDMSQRKNIYLFSKEAINNAVKYSGCSNIFYSIEELNNRIILEIKDDGKGFDKASIARGNGLNNMQARAEELNGELQIESTPGAGTGIQLNMNFHPIGGQKEMV